MTKFEYFDKGFARVGMEFGVVSICEFTKFIRYKVYLDFRNDGYDKSTSIELTAERCRCCQATVYNSINHFLKDLRNI